MNSASKVLIALATVPLMAFVVGSLASTASDEPPPRPALEISDRPSEQSGSQEGPSTSTPRRSKATVVTPRPGTAQDRQRGPASPADGPDDDERDDKGDDDD